MDGRFERTERLIGSDALKLLENSHIAVFGLGGVGSYVTEALCRAGVGRLTLIDNDIISSSNINRQLYALDSTIGMLKTEAARQRVLDINPNCKVNTIAKFYLPENRDCFFGEEYSYIVDAIDTITAKIDIAEQAMLRDISIISSMGTGNKLNPFLFEISDIYKTSVCPLCRVMRRELKAKEIGSLKVLYSKEKPIKTRNGAGDKSPPSSISFVPSAAGLLIASEVIRDIIGISEDEI